MSDDKTLPPAHRADRTPALLRYGFRPFFLFAGIWGTVAVPLWLGAFTGFPGMPAAADSLLWHQHEMLFGFAAAAISGFILTAIPNWTGRLPVRGWRLGVLAGCWLAGRAAMLSSATIGPAATAVLDLALLTLLALTIARELVCGRNWRNLPVLAVISLFATANWLVHAERTGLADTAAAGIRLAIFVLAVLVALIGGRIIPSFTRNWLKRQGATALPASAGALDKAALAAIVLVLATQVFWPDTRVAAVIALVAALLHAARLARWKTLRVLSEPLVWVLHLGYAWIVLGLLLLGLAGLSDGVPESAALHALSTGGFATMILAVMSRASLGHSGRQLTADTGTTVVFALVTIAAATRVIAAFLDNAYTAGIWISGAAWTAAFWRFTAIYWPVLTRANAAK